MTDKAPPTTSIAHSTPDTITVRGKHLVDELIGKISFTEMMLLHFKGNLPRAAETRVLDAVLVTLMEHGITPSAIATRLIYYSSPDALQGAVAAGLLGVGSTFIGTMEGCAQLLQRIADTPQEQRRACAKQIAIEHRDAQKALPGFGHPHHKPDDPRTPRLLQIAAEEDLAGAYVAALQLLAEEVDLAMGRHLTINATGAVAALLAEIGIPVRVMRGVAVVSRAAGLVGHIVEEQQQPSGAFIWQTVDRSIPYQPD